MLLLLSSGRVAASGTAAEVLTEETVAAHFDARVRDTRGPDGRPRMTLMRP